MSRREELVHLLFGVVFPVSGFIGDWMEVSGLVTKVGCPQGN